MILVIFLLMQSYKACTKNKNYALAKISQAQFCKCLIFKCLIFQRFEKISQSC